MNEIINKLKQNPDHVFIETVNNYGKAYSLTKAFPNIIPGKEYFIIDEYLRNNMHDKNILLRDESGFTAFYPAEYFKIRQ